MPKRNIIRNNNNYNKWANDLAKKWGISKRTLEQDDYDYKGFYESNPSTANAILRGSRNVHFPDTYKLPSHPTFSEESKYSGRYGNPIGGHWKDNSNNLQRWTYQLSPDQVRKNWNVRRTLEYAGEAEDEGFRITDNKDKYPIINGVVQGGILPTITVRPKQKDGGSIHIAPSKRGTFTAAATKHNMGVQEFASKVLRNKDSYSPAMVKKANFAKNASKWN